VPLANDIAILRTVLYADVFDYPLTPDEIHRYLIGKALPFESILSSLNSSLWLAQRIERVNGYYVAAGRVALAETRHHRSAHAQKLWREARRYGRMIAHCPFVRMVAVTGALAMDNVKPDDDIDYLIVTAPRRVWLARAFAILIVRLARVAGVNLCPNYVLSESALAQARLDLYVAHEIAQMIPIAGYDVYQRMRALNNWVEQYLPNARPVPRLRWDEEAHTGRSILKKFLEKLLSGSPGDALENWERSRKTKKFESQARAANSAALLDETHAKGHFNDYGQRALTDYEARCKLSGL
jgi:hypothetical protein